MPPTWHALVSPLSADVALHPRRHDRTTIQPLADRRRGRPRWRAPGRPRPARSSPHPAILGLRRLARPCRPAVFVVGYALATVGFIPGSLLTLSAGAIFGLGWGVALVFMAATLGSTLAFLIARYGARQAIARRVDSNPQFAAVSRAIAAPGTPHRPPAPLPAFPFSLLNYALASRRSRSATMLLAGVGMLQGPSSTSTTASSPATTSLRSPRGRHRPAAPLLRGAPGSGACSPPLPSPPS
ncbi:MAG: TVP38/TMEM64 family protein [Gemmatimonadetes bacterium]|nr:TVP38/TMEM64 family protein [Gemmatimonadota bacterium]